MNPIVNVRQRLSQACIGLSIAAAAFVLPSAASYAADRTGKDQPTATMRRDLPPGTSEAEVRRYCTRKFDEEAGSISDMAGGEGGMLTGQLFAAFQACLRRNGVRR